MSLEEGWYYGVVLVDNDACLGRDSCNICLSVCPYEAPQFGDEDNAKMQKCNFCVDRLMESKKPVCVEACTMRALDVGFTEEKKHAC
ncbi:4Fe-4S dicluster domain-containing protein [Chloroflexota bacterium]